MFYRLLLTFGLLFSAPGLAAGGVHDEFDTNKDNVVSFAEHTAGVDAKLRKMDSDHDGQITLREYTAYLVTEMPAAPIAVHDAIARCFFKGLGGQDGKLSSQDMRAYEDRVFKWLAGPDLMMTREESTRVPPSDIVPTPVCR